MEETVLKSELSPRRTRSRVQFPTPLEYARPETLSPFDGWRRPSRRPTEQATYDHLRHFSAAFTTASSPILRLPVPTRGLNLSSTETCVRSRTECMRSRLCYPIQSFLKVWLFIDISFLKHHPPSHFRLRDYAAGRGSRRFRRCLQRSESTEGISVRS